MRIHSLTSRRARQAITWALVWYVSVQGAVRLLLSLRPEIGDPEFGRKLADLRTDLAGAPGRPLVLALGSSRMATGFRPDALLSRPGGSGTEAVVYNFAQVGSGPELSLLTLYRLLSEGVRPSCVLVEFWPPVWTASRGQHEVSVEINLGRLDWKSVLILARYVPLPRQLYRTWLSAQLFPLSTNRYVLRRELASRLHLAAVETDRRCRNLDRHGWWSPTLSVESAERKRLVEQYRATYEPLLRRFHIEECPDRALRELIALCRSRKIAVCVVLLPESREFRQLYPPAALREVTDYLAKIERETGVEVIDARRWVGDDGFMDGHHLLPSGATVFTQRLGSEVLDPRTAAFTRAAHPGQFLARDPLP